MIGSTFRSVSLLVFLAVVLLVSVPSTSAQPGCYPCVVSSCAAFFNGSSPNISIGALSPTTAAAECSTLNTDLAGFIGTAQHATCAANVAGLACDIIATVNQTEVACNTSSIGIGTSFGNVTYFQQRCSSAVGCLGYTYQDEVVAASACSSFSAFLGAIVAQPQPSATACTKCNITACYGLSSLPNAADVSFFTGSLPGINGSACAYQQAVAANLLASGLAGAQPAQLHSLVCDPLAALTTYDTEMACNAGLVDSIFDGVIFSAATAYNTTWSSFCQPSLSQVLNATAVSRLVESGYCVSPSAGLTKYAVQYLQASPVTTVSSSGTVSPTSPGTASSSGVVSPTSPGTASSFSSTGSISGAAAAQGEVALSTVLLLALSFVASLLA